MGMDVTGASGNYFRASVWSWRPINVLCEELNQDKQLGLDLSYWGYNDGKGLNTQAECDALANAIEEHVKQGRQKYIIVSHMQVSPSGQFLPPGEVGESAYSTDAAHVLKFAKFLRECGGSFEIW